MAGPRAAQETPLPAAPLKGRGDKRGTVVPISSPSCPPSFLGEGAISSVFLPISRGVILSESEESGAEGLDFILFSRPSASDSSLSLRMTPRVGGMIGELIGPALLGEGSGEGFHAAGYNMR